MADDDDKLPRRLGAVLLADMKDYSAVMGADEARAIAGVDDIGAVFAEVVPRHGGTFEITSGDRFFAVFDSAVEAFEAAVAIQRALAARAAAGGPPWALRIGLHVGEVVRTPFGLMGDSINVAARLQAIAEPGGIALSDDLYRLVRNRAHDVAFRDLGSQRLKNIRDPVRVHAARPAPAAAATGAPAAATPPTSRVARRAVLAALAAAGGGLAVWRAGVWWRAGVAPGLPRTATPLVVGVMAVRVRGHVPGWMSGLTREALDTLLSKQPDLLVCSRQKIDFVREKRGLTEMEAAEQLGIGKMVSTTLSGAAAGLVLEVQLIDIRTGLIEGSHEVRGAGGQLIRMQNEAALAVVRALKLPVAVELERLLTRRTDDRLEDYKLLTETMGGLVDDAGAAGEPRSGRPGRRPLVRLAPHEAHAGEDETAIQALLERYRAALEAESLPEVAALHVALPDTMRDALARYFANAERLRVAFSRMDILVEGDEALATFTRSDDFVDASSGVPVHLEVRVSNVVARHDGAWRILGLKKPG